MPLLALVLAFGFIGLTELVGAMLTDEGYEVSILTTTDHDSIAAEVGRFEPDCILLDGSGSVEFGGSWTHAAYLADRSRRVPTVMFTAHSQAVLEARDATSDRARAAGFAAVLAPRWDAGWVRRGPPPRARRCARHRPDERRR